VSGLAVSSAETSASLAAIVSAVDAQPPDYRTQTSPEGMLTVVFTDLEGSTEMLELLGENRWLEVMVEHNRLIRECVTAHGGEVVESQGDGFMITFASATAALRCAVETQRILARYNAENPAQRLQVRIGMHTGNVFQADQDFLGRAVVLAARITGRARGGEILVSEACRAYTRRLGGWHYGEPAELTLKGLASVERVYSLQWAQPA
jgi:class 3 adenylate cyclase